MNILLETIISIKKMHLALTVLSVTSVKITELNLTHADLQFVPGVGLLFGVQNSSITLSFHRQILYWLLLVLTFLWFDLTITSLLIWIFLMWWSKVAFFLFWCKQWSELTTYDLCYISAMTQGISTLQLKVWTSIPSSIWSEMMTADWR